MGTQDDLANVLEDWYTHVESEDTTLEWQDGREHAEVSFPYQGGEFVVAFRLSSECLVIQMSYPVAPLHIWEAAPADFKEAVTAVAHAHKPHQCRLSIEAGAADKEQMIRYRRHLFATDVSRQEIADTVTTLTTAIQESSQSLYDQNLGLFMLEWADGALDPTPTIGTPDTDPAYR